MARLKRLNIMMASLALTVGVGHLGGCSDPAEGGDPQADVQVDAENQADVQGQVDVQTDLAAGDYEVARSEKSRDESPAVDFFVLSELVGGNSEFAFDFYQAVRSEDGNLFYSPHSISIALAMTYGGARGETASQMASAMSFTLSPEELHPAFNYLDLELATRNELPEYEEGEGFVLRVANATWGQVGYPFLESYLDLLAENYGAGIYLVDFSTDTESARLLINDWVEEQTEDKIQDLIPPGGVDSLTRLVLTNAIYFFAPWDFPFELEDTSDAAFNLMSGETVTVPMMSQIKELQYLDGDGYQVVEMPYNGQTLSMTLILPDEGSFETVESTLAGSTVAAMIDGLEVTNVTLSMPRFEFESQFNLNAVLQDMGMVDAFSETSADFSGMDGSTDLYISGVLHKAFVSVDEEGTEAAAATAVIVGTTSVPPPPIPVTLDRPFIFLIRDIPTGAILFVGRVVDPS